jgi:hypothetical protein
MLEGLVVALIAAGFGAISAYILSIFQEICRAKRYQSSFIRVLVAIIHQHKIFLESLVAEAKVANPKSLSGVSEVDPILIDNAISELMGTRFMLSLDQLLFITNFKVTLEMIRDQSHRRSSDLKVDSYGNFRLDGEKEQQTIELIGWCIGLINLTEDFINQGERYKRPSLYGKEKSTLESNMDMVDEVCSKHGIELDGRVRMRISAYFGA